MDRKKFFSLCLLVAGAALIYSVCAAAPLMVEHNLFAPDRKAPGQEAETVTQPAQVAGLAVSAIQLDGVMIQGNTRKALVRLKNAPGAGQTGIPQPPGTQAKQKSPFMSVTEGQQIGDFRVTKVESKSISVEKNGQSFTIALIAPNKIVSPAAVPPPPQPAPPPVPQEAGQPPQPAQNQAGFPPQEMQQGQQVPPPANPGTPGYAEPAPNPQTQVQELPPPVEEPPQVVNV